MGNFSPCYGRITDQCNVREEGFILVHASKAQSTMVGKSWCQEHRTAGHVISTVRKQREMDAGTWLAFSFVFSTGSQPIGMVQATG